MRVRFGKYRTTLDAGVHLRIPYVDSVYRQSVRLRVCTAPVQTVTTKDGKTVTLASTIGYKITDIALLYDTLHHAEDTIRNIAQAGIADDINTHTALECSPAEVESRVNNNLSLNQYGIGEAKIHMISYAFVRTYRLIQDGHWGGSGDSLSTDNAETAGSNKAL